MGNSEDSPVLRRSLRILAKEKHKEDLQQQQHQTSLLGEQSGGSICDKPGSSSTEVWGKSTSKRNQKTSCQGADRKSKRTASPKQTRSPSPVLPSNKRKRSPSVTASLPPSKKATKNSPVTKRRPSKEAVNTATDSASLLAAAEDLGNKEGGKKKQSKKRQEGTQRGCEGRDSVIVYVPKKSKGRKGQSANHTRTESETSVESSRKKGKSKRRRSRGKSGTQSEEGQANTHKGKGRSAWGPPFSLVDFPRLNMASPE